jgi:outer membrane receptor for ferrienterochelin and colicin
MIITKWLRWGFLTILWIAATPVFGQYDYAEGRVTAIEGEEVISLPGATVHWAGSSLGTMTDLSGEFYLEKVKKTNLLVVSYIGYVTDTLVYQGQYIEVNLKTGVELNTVDVVGREESAAHFLLDPLNVQKIGSKELRKAACCNLSESFETNASIDASFTDAVTGTRQIKMLGLSGRYSQILKDNMPNVRGLSTIYGLGYIPGDWIEDIHISKGAGSVTSGFESITGEINVAIKDADIEEKAHFNVYGNQGGRMEFNGNAKWKVSDTWSTILLAHSEVNQTENDNNSDGFLDNPLQQDFAIRNQWRFHAKEHWEGQYAVNYLEQHQVSGQSSDLATAPEAELWKMHLDAQRFEASAKTGYVLDDRFGSSFGSQFSIESYQQELTTGQHAFTGEQNTFRANLLYATKLGCEKKGLTVGVTALVDDYDVLFDSLDLGRNEKVFGAYGEFTWTPNERLSTIIGMRIDEHNLFGTMYSPRLHLRYSLTEDLSFKAAAGRGYRTANPVTDNLGLIASSRDWNIEAPLIQESGWNVGANLTYKFRIDYRDATLAVDAYRTQFDQLAVIDVETYGEVNVYGLEGDSYANTAQIEFGWEIMRRTDIRLAYRYTDARTDFRQGLLVNPFNPKHRGFVNMGYSTKANDKGGQWKIDATVQLVGEQRLPSIGENWDVLPLEDDLLSKAPNFVQIHGQVSRIFKKGLEAYLGMENATDFRQDTPILSADDPYSELFDASRVWAPVFGRMAYAGLRWTIL